MKPARDLPFPHFATLAEALEIAPLYRDAYEQDTFVIFDPTDEAALYYHLATGEELRTYYAATRDDEVEAVFFYDPPESIAWQAWMARTSYQEAKELKP